MALAQLSNKIPKFCSNLNIISVLLFMYYVKKSLYIP